jgi:hypothetical protein
LIFAVHYFQQDFVEYRDHKGAVDLGDPHSRRKFKGTSPHYQNWESSFKDTIKVRDNIGQSLSNRKLNTQKGGKKKSKNLSPMRIFTKNWKLWVLESFGILI